MVQYAPIVELSALDGTDDFKLRGVAAQDFSGVSVSLAGDVNNDGFDDFIIGAPGADAGGFSSGASYLVFGATGGFSADLAVSTLDGADRFRLSGAAYRPPYAHGFGHYRDLRAAHSLACE